MNVSRIASYVQGIYYVVAGIWPVVYYKGFTSFTGPKTDDWLVKAMGLMFFAVGAGILVNSRNGIKNRGILAIAVLTPFFMIVIDVFYAFNGRISKVYYLDAVAEFFILCLWIISCVKTYSI